MRGLGYWYFYGLGPDRHWTRPPSAYTQWLWLIAMTFAVPAIGFLVGTSSGGATGRSSSSSWCSAWWWPSAPFPYFNPTGLG